MADDLVFNDPKYRLDQNAIRAFKDALIVNLNTPPGGAGLLTDVYRARPARPTCW